MRTKKEAWENNVGMPERRRSISVVHVKSTLAGCSKSSSSKAAGSSATEAYPCGTLQGDERLRTPQAGFFSILLRFLPEEERSIKPGDGDGDEFNRQQQSAYNGVRCGGRENEMQAEEFGSLRRRGFPGWEEDREGQHSYHAVEEFKVELSRSRCRAWR